jgi:hypothetical protein
MFATVEVLRGMLIFRRITATHMPAFQAQPQMHPGASNFYAVFTNVGVGGCSVDLIEMSALFHIPPSPEDPG